MSDNNDKLDKCLVVLRIDKISEAKVTLARPNGKPVGLNEYPYRMLIYLDWKDSNIEKVNRKWVLNEIMTIEPTFRYHSDKRNFNFIIEKIIKTKQDLENWKQERSNNGNY